MSQGPKAVLAFSGGVDSTLLLALLADGLGSNNVEAVLVDSSFGFCDERLRAQELCDLLGVHLTVLPFDPLADGRISSNPPERCYLCKYEMLSRIKEAFPNSVVVDGTNADDAQAHRPGALALEELGVQSPLKDAGLGKDEIREMSHELGLPTWNMPSNSCLATRFPYGERLTQDGLRVVEQAEKAVKEEGFDQVRVRCHGDIARIEVAREDVSRLAGQAVTSNVASRLHGLGFKHICVDVEGFRSGSMDGDSNV